MAIFTAPPPSVSGNSLHPNDSCPEFPAAPERPLPTTPSDASSISDQSQGTSLASSSSLSRADGLSRSITSTSSDCFDLSRPVNSKIILLPFAISRPSTAPTVNLSPILHASPLASLTSSRPDSQVVRMSTIASPVKADHSLGPRSPPNQSSSSYVNNHRASTAKSSYFHWEPGATPKAIYDPEYPDGPPTCLAPRPALSTDITSMEEEEDYYFCTNRPLGLSEFMTSDDRMGDFHSIFGPGPFDEDTAVDPVGSVPWEEMPQFIRRHNRELVKREKEQEKTVAKDVAVRKLERQERSTVTDARFHKGEWKLLDDIPPLIELVQRAGREEEKRISVKVDGSVELVGIGFFKHLPEADQERIVKERAELAMWLKGELEEKPEFLLKELEAYEKRLTENGMCNKAEEVVEAGSSTTNPDLSAIVASRTGLQLDLPIGTQEDTLAPALEEEQGQCASPPVE